MTKRMISCTVDSFELEDCSVDEMLEKLNECKKQYPNVELHISYEYLYEFEGPDHIDVYFNRIETDEEQQEREDLEKNHVEKHRKITKYLGECNNE